VREGENRTGDAAFADEIAEGVRRDVAATLARSGDFSEVVLVPFEAGEWSRSSRACSTRDRR
jgi:hypothetical protein